jgi:hypothetical protein
MTDQLRVNGNLVDSLGNAVRHGGTALGTVPGLLRRVLETGAWREFVTQRGEHVPHARFADFVTTPPLKGLGATMDLIERVVADDPVTLDLLDKELQRPVGTNQHGKGEAVNNINTLRPVGTSKAAALRKLRKDAPELHAKVLAKEMSAHAAMVQAGFRHRMVSVNMDDPLSGANTVLRNASPEYLAEFRRLLNKEVTSQ